MRGKTIYIATRGSALALAQANAVLAQCRKTFPKLEFELRIIKTTGDKFLNVSLANPDASLPKGLFTKELEVALLKGRADLAVHSLKDLPTELPEGLKLGAVAGKRADVRDVIIYKKTLAAGPKLADWPKRLTVATSSTRRQAQLLTLRPDFKVVEIRGNVPTRLRKLAGDPALDATILAAAGIGRLKFKISASGKLSGTDVPEGLLAKFLETDEMLPCVGQAAIGLEVRSEDEQTASLCRELNDESTFQCVTAERALLRALGGGCHMPLGAHATLSGTELHLRAVSYLNDTVRRAEAHGSVHEAAKLGEIVAEQLKN